jgi:hypothetical protein
MPITTPKPYAEQLDDPDHFIHVLESLFKPALTKANYEVISPISAGSELIQAAIIKNLEECELVLCDISALNPNVFFELGIRTALNKPAVIVRDGLTPTIPFDTASINAHTYDVGLRAWLIESEINKLAEHITTTATKSGGNNALWRFFGITQTAQPARVDNPTEAKLDLIMSEVAELKRASDRASSAALTNYGGAYSGIAVNPSFTTTGLGTVYANYGGSLWAQSPSYDPNMIPVSSAPAKFQDFGKAAQLIASREGVNVEIEGYNTKTRKLIMNCGNSPLSVKTAAEISGLAMKRKVEFELRR